MRTAPVRSHNKKLIYLPGAKQAVPAKRKRTVSILLIAAVLYFSLLFAGQYWRSLQLRRALAELQAEIQIVKAQNESMSKEIERLHSPAYIEQKAREDLGMVRSGELLFFFQDRDKPSAQLP
jgi:cell division protein FtsL